jgi:integrase
MRLLAGPKWRDAGLVFTTEIGSHLVPTNVRKRHWLSLLERAGLPKLRMYDLRHSAASLMLALGISPKVVAEMLGHASVQLTLDTYSHTTPTLHRDAVRQLNDLLAGQG